MVDGVEGSTYNGIGAGGPIFSPDSKRVAYAANKGNKWIVLVDGVEGFDYDGIVKGAKIVFDSSNQLHYLAGKGSRFYLVDESIGN